MPVPVHGQTWSKPSITTPQSESYCAPGGRYLRGRRRARERASTHTVAGDRMKRVVAVVAGRDSPRGTAATLAVAERGVRAPREASADHHARARQRRRWAAACGDGVARSADNISPRGGTKACVAQRAR